MRNQKGPGKTVTKIAQLCKDKGIDLVYFNDKNISMKRNKIKGKVWMEEQWNKIEIDVPAIIDISPLCRKHKKKVAYLKEHAYLTDNMDHVLNKVNLYELLREDEQLSTYAVPTIKIENYKDVLSFLRENDVAKMQALFKKSYDGETLVKYENRLVQVEENDTQTSFELPEFEAWFKERIGNKTFIAQQNVNLNGRDDKPFYCRFQLDKNEHNEWTTTDMAIWIGEKGDDYYTIQDRNNSADVETFLSNAFGLDKATTILGTLHDICFKVAKSVEQYRQHELITIGIDYGITTDGKIYIIEANNSPALKSDIQNDVAEKRIGYYTYLMNKLNLE